MCAVMHVALRKESVDRNRCLSRSASIRLAVALRKESVDRNIHIVKSAATLGESLSARRAWIEIFFKGRSCFSGIVALRKESVDRNAKKLNSTARPSGRSPQGERG